VLPNTGHWIMEESPQATADALMQFLNGAPVSASIPDPH
jgi:pimeloyl-ACP methyl ester carboxylesterase